MQSIYNYTLINIYILSSVNMAFKI